MWYIPHGGAQILVLEIFYIFTKALTSWRLRLKFSPSLTLNKIERFETGSLNRQKTILIGGIEMSATYLLSPLVSLWKIFLAYGHDPKPIFSQEGIDYDMILTPGKRIPFRAIDNLWTKATDLIENPCFGLRTTEFWHPSAANTLGYACIASSTLREGLTRLQRYARMISGTAEVHLDETAEGLKITLSDSLKHPARMDFAKATALHLQ